MLLKGSGHLEADFTVFNVDPRRDLFSQAALLYQLVIFLPEVEQETELTLTQVMILGRVGTFFPLELNRLIWKRSSRKLCFVKQQWTRDMDIPLYGC
jgi:hypothetical protein